MALVWGTPRIKSKSGRHFVGIWGATEMQLCILHAHEFVTDVEEEPFFDRAWVFLRAEDVKRYGLMRLVALLDEEIAPGAHLNQLWLAALYAALSAHADSEQ